MPAMEWDELLKDPRLIGGQVRFVEGGRNFVGEIRHIAPYGTNAFFFFLWAAYKTKRGWTYRKRRGKTIHRLPVAYDEKTSVYNVGGDEVSLKDNPNLVKRSEVAPPFTREQQHLTKRKADPLPLFDK